MRDDRKKWAWVAAVLGTALLVVGAAFALMRPTRLERQFDKVRAGMTMSEVDSQLGRPLYSVTVRGGGYVFHVYVGGPAAAKVEADLAGRVTRVDLHPPTPWQRLKYRLTAWRTP